MKTIFLDIDNYVYRIQLCLTQLLLCIVVYVLYTLSAHTIIIVFITKKCVYNKQ